MTTATGSSQAPLDPDQPVNSYEAKHIYELWASAAGTYDDFFPWEYLSVEDQRRWLFFFKGAVSWGGPHYEPRPTHKDAEKYAAFYEGVAYDYMYVVGEASGLADKDLKPYEEWKAAKESAAHPKWWQFWRKPTDPGPLDYAAYYHHVWEQEETARKGRAREQRIEFLRRRGQDPTHYLDTPGDDGMLHL